jgi:F0F1-type ATP synthase delta subunit
MFGKMGEMMKQFQTMQTLMKDEHFRALLSHPKVQTLFRDPAFQEAVKSKDPSKIMSHPQLAELLRDPDVAPLLAKIDPQALLGGMA